MLIKLNLNCYLLRQKLYYYLVIFFLSSPVFAVYDAVSINIIPSPEGVSFCFLVDGNEEAMYLALSQNQQELTFLSLTENRELVVTPWQPPMTPPIFLKKGERIKPDCFGPYSREVLKNIQLYAGAGDSFDDVLNNQKYLRFFNGFPDLTSEEKAWTVMVYMVGSTLEREAGNVSLGVRAVTKGFASRDILEMIAGNQTASTVNVVTSTGGSVREGWNTVKRSLIREGQNYVIEDLGVQNMSDPQTLVNFVTWATTQFPAQHYALILWDHGGGTQGYGQDSASGNSSMMTLNQLNQAYQTIRQQLAKPLDVVVYDACLMASIEVAEVTAIVAQAMAGSAELEPGHGIDYHYLLNNMNIALPTNGIEFGKIVKEGYIQHTRDSGTFKRSQITYSVFDLTRLSSFSEAFKKFATEFMTRMEKENFADYTQLNHGIIRAPGYPFIEAGKLASLRSSGSKNHIRVDFYNFLQTIGSQFPEFKTLAEESLDSLRQVIVDYAVNDNVSAIDAEAGRVSIDIAVNYDEMSQSYNIAPYLDILPESYRMVHQGLTHYDQRKRRDESVPEGEKVCPRGMTCAFAQWLKLKKEDVDGVEIYYGQQSENDNITIYRINKSFYHNQVLTADELENGLKVDGTKACQYQLCSDENHCEDLTLIEQGTQWVADIQLNDLPALLSFCQGNNDQESRSICGVVQQDLTGVWGRDDFLYPNDAITLQTLRLVGNQLLPQMGHTLIVHNPQKINLQKQCNSDKGVISAGFFGTSGQREVQRLCDSGDCVCREHDTDPGCVKVGAKVGIYIE